MASRLNTETVSIPKQTMERVRKHLEAHADRLGRPMQLSQFFGEAARLLIAKDLQEMAWEVEQGLGEDVGMDEEQAATWADAPGSRSQRKKA